MGRIEGDMPQETKKDSRRFDVIPFSVKYRRRGSNPHDHYRHWILNPIPKIQNRLTHNRLRQQPTPSYRLAYRNRSNTMLISPV